MDYTLTVAVSTAAGAAALTSAFAEAVREPADSAGLFTTLLDRFGALGGVDLDLPGREEPARAAEFSA